MIDTLVLDTLSLMHALLRHGWCRNYEAMTEEGWSVPPTNLRAERWCLSGALRAAREEVFQGLPHQTRHQCTWLIDDLLRAEIPEGMDRQLWWFNDDAPNRRPVLRLIERAAARIGKG